METTKEQGYGMLVSQDGVILQEGISIESFDNNNFRSTFNGNKWMPKIDYMKISKVQMSIAHILFMLTLIANSSSSNMVRDSKQKIIKGNYRAVAEGYNKDYKTVARYFYQFLKLDLIRKSQGHYFINPMYAIRFSLKNPPVMIVSAFPESFTESTYFKCAN